MNTFMASLRVNEGREIIFKIGHFRVLLCLCFKSGLV